MSKYIERIPLADISRIQLYINKSVKSLDEIKAETGADYLLNGGVYSGTKAVMHLKADGYVCSEDPYHYWGYAWDTGPDISMELVPCGKANYINCTELIQAGVPNPKPAYNPDMGGSRQRSAMGLMGEKLVLYCSTEPTTPEELRDELAGMGCSSALMLDGGGSSQCDFKGKHIDSGRKVHNLILVYLKHKEDEPTKDIITRRYTTKNPCYTRDQKAKKTCLMLHSTATPGATAADLIAAWDKPTASAGVEFVLDPTGIYQCLPLGVKSGHCAGSGNTTHVGVEVCEPDETIFLPINWRPLSRGGRYNRPYAVKRLQQELAALGFDPKGVDGSFGPGCEAAVRAYQKSVGIAADGSVGPATLRYLQRREGSYLRYDEARAEDYFKEVYGKAVALFAWLAGEVGCGPEDIVCHCEGYRLGIASNHADVLHWFPQHGKTMDGFRADVAAAMAGETVPADPLGEAVDKLAARGILDSPDYWKGGDYSAENVRRLIIKWAATI